MKSNGAFLDNDYLYRNHTLGMLRNAKFGPVGAILSPFNSGAPFWICFPGLTKLPSVFPGLTLTFVRVLGFWVVGPGPGYPTTSSFSFTLFSVLKGCCSILISLLLRLLVETLSVFGDHPCFLFQWWTLGLIPLLLLRLHPLGPHRGNLKAKPLKSCRAVALSGSCCRAVALSGPGRPTRWVRPQPA
jgi:hypothetical protein